MSPLSASTNTYSSHSICIHAVFYNSIRINPAYTNTYTTHTDCDRARFVHTRARERAREWTIDGLSHSHSLHTTRTAGCWLYCRWKNSTYAGNDRQLRDRWCTTDHNTHARVRRARAHQAQTMRGKSGNRRTEDEGDKSADDVDDDDDDCQPAVEPRCKTTPPAAACTSRQPSGGSVTIHTPVFSVWVYTVYVAITITHINA